MKKYYSFLILLTSLLFVNNLLFSQKFYVSPLGNDKNPGTFESPLATLTAARDIAREYRKKTPDLNQPVEIIALEGEYFMLQPLLLLPGT